MQLVFEEAMKEGKIATYAEAHAFLAERGIEYSQARTAWAGSSGVVRQSPRQDVPATRRRIHKSERLSKNLPSTSD
jgi:hypothetical protein